MGDPMQYRWNNATSTNRQLQECEFWREMSNELGKLSQHLREICDKEYMGQNISVVPRTEEVLHKSAVSNINTTSTNLQVECSTSNIPVTMYTNVPSSNTMYNDNLFSEIPNSFVHPPPGFMLQPSAPQTSASVQNETTDLLEDDSYNQISRICDQLDAGHNPIPRKGSTETTVTMASAMSVDALVEDITSNISTQTNACSSISFSDVSCNNLANDNNYVSTNIGTLSKTFQDPIPGFPLLSSVSNGSDTFDLVQSDQLDPLGSGTVQLTTVVDADTTTQDVIVDSWEGDSDNQTPCLLVQTRAMWVSFILDAMCQDSITAVVPESSKDNTDNQVPEISDRAEPTSTSLELSLQEPEQKVSDTNLQTEVFCEQSSEINQQSVPNDMEMVLFRSDEDQQNFTAFVEESTNSVTSLADSLPDHVQFLQDRIRNIKRVTNVSVAEYSLGNFPRISFVRGITVSGYMEYMKLHVHREGFCLPVNQSVSTTVRSLQLEKQSTGARQRYFSNIVVNIERFNFVFEEDQLRRNVPRTKMKQFGKFRVGILRQNHKTDLSKLWNTS